LDASFSSFSSSSLSGWGPFTTAATLARAWNRTQLKS
jgi:hypothetical protein